jgi:hypothetical protein
MLELKELEETNELKSTCDVKRIVYNRDTIVPKNKSKKQSKSESKEETKRVECLKWFIHPSLLNHGEQLSILNGGAVAGFSCAYFDSFSLFKQQIEQKLNGYKQQDIKKNMYNAEAFVTFGEAVSLLHCCGLVCAYCEKEVYVLYENVRDPQQWSLDRVNNDIGHNSLNLVIACLRCNLRRRRINMDAFMFTRQMKLVKVS